ncbi:exodeoxyribonuclease VII large subunit [Shouchella rhizosphaerae]|uniref:Exodeoxyribonuclease 7 large subunit n=1 Tax=Shouchella rhizosphaerae TaxID=866786 RepID=A0ABZ2CWJ5_9BACI
MAGNAGVAEAWTVSEATRYIKQLLEDDPHLPEIWIRGELSNFKQHTRGHMYFTIKDEGSRMQAVMFAGYNRFLRFKPENGMNVLIRGEINVYEPYGQYQFYAKEMQPDGIGSLFAEYERLKKALEAEGLFAEERKRPIPRFPTHIAIITSPTGAVIRDMMTTLKRRYPQIRVTLFPVLVQGEGAPLSISRALEQASMANIFDVVIVARGGGSIEELWAFNEEMVARAIAEAAVPVISAVGHETDFTISDFAADRRAPTPTAAAEFAVPDARELMEHIGHLKKRLERSLVEQVKTRRRELERLKRSYAFRYPVQLVHQKEQQLDGLMERLNRAIQIKLEQKTLAFKHMNQAILRQHPATRVSQLQKERRQNHARLVRAMAAETQRKRQSLSAVIQQLQLLSPLAVMDRGYSLVYKDEALVKTAKDVEIEDDIVVKLADGNLHCQVVGKREMKNGGESNG